jgi:uncharacterized Ntn-hydrolase superfamily protein
MTFSIVARCPRSGCFAVAVSSSSPAVAARCAYARAGVGAVASQNVTDPRLGARGLDLLAGGMAAAEVIAELVGAAPHVDYRQLAVVDRAGRAAYFSGARSLGVHAAVAAEDAAAAGNLLADAAVPQRMLEAFAARAGEELGDRVIAAMQAGLAAGGEAGPVRSAGLLLVDAVDWPIADLRVDWHDAPIAELERLWQLWWPQMADYVQRALHPDRSPAFGVPGNE